MTGRSAGWTIAALALAACGGAAQNATANAANDVRLADYDEEPPGGEAAVELQRAVELIDVRQLGRATEILESLRRRYPNNGTVLHELGLAYRMDGRPQRAVELLSPYEEVLGVTATAGLGSAADEAHDPARAETVLRRGIARHPRAGLLYSELAIVVGRQRRMDEAVELFLAGMHAEPSWPTNYLHAANIFSQSRAAGLTLYWGEIFRLLEPDSERSGRMAIAMVEVLRAHVSIGPPGADGDRTVSVSLAPGAAQVTLQQGGVMTMPFVHALELGLGVVLGGAVLDGLSLASLHAARSTFLSSAAPHPDTELFRWLAALAAAGHLEAYDVWLYGPAFPDQAAAWITSHRDRINALGRYLEAHPFTPTRAIAPEAPVPLPAGASPPPANDQAI